MNTPGKVVAGICIFSTLFMGCYSSSIIDFAGDEKEKMYANDVTSVLTKDGKKYDFETPPGVVNDTIVGVARFAWYREVNQEESSIPLSNVAARGQSYSGDIEYVVTNTGAKYIYDEPPAVVNRMVVGKGTFAGYMSVNAGQVSIPLSDVAEMSVSEPSPGLTLGALAIIVAVGVGVFLVALSAGKQGRLAR
jgi:hypothetical protein